MGSIISKGTGLFPEELVKGMVNLVKGKSAIANLCDQTPIAFNGNKEFTFDMDSEIDIVAENGAKSNGGATIGARTIVPFKVEYGTRVSDEFMQENEDYQLNVLQAFTEGFAKKLARGLDIMAFHGLNPRTATASTIIGTNCFDLASGITKVTSGTGDANDWMEAAIAAVQGNEWDVNGAAMAPAFRSALAALTYGTDNLQPRFPELAWGSAPSTIKGLPTQVNSTVAFNNSKDLAIVGDFQNGFKWGYAKDIPVKVIEFGNPDNDTTLGDLQGHNQVYLRAEAYLGFSILVPAAFAIVEQA
jgi:HK97 family phage major capsid protein